MELQKKIGSLLKKRVVLLDGAMGTQLQASGMPTGVSPEMWCLTSSANRQTLLGIHRRYLEAGADIIYSCTFGANRGKLPHLSGQECANANRELVAIARQAVRASATQHPERRLFVAGDIGPTGRLIEPFGDFPFEEAITIFQEQVRALLAGGVDLIAIETMLDIQEARAALLAVRETAATIPTIVTLTFEEDGKTLGGTDPLSALITLQSLGADIVGCNCSLGPEAMVPIIAAMKPYASVPLAAKPNAGLPKVHGKEVFFDMEAIPFATHAKALALAGANLVGGCCGTTPTHIAATAEALTGISPVLPRRNSLTALSSPRASLVLESASPLVIIGERINPTGKKALQEDVRRGDFTLVRELALEQEQQGAALLDVNVGMPDIDEAQTLRRITAILATATSLPLVFDSSNPAALEAALRLYPGRALLNSLSGEKAKMESLPILAKKYGAMLIVLPITEKGVPQTSQERVAIITAIYKKLKESGIGKEDIIVDGVTMSVATDSRAALETLATLRWCSGRFKARTVLGVSNVSFGMPQRPSLNAALLALARSAGLTMAIINPANTDTLDIAAATDLLLGFDQDAQRFLQICGKAKSAVAVSGQIEKSTPEQKVRATLLTGAKENITKALREALAGGCQAGTLVDGVLIPAIIEVGARYERREYFLPQLLASAETMKRGMEFLQGFLLQERPQQPEDTIVIATVEGDVHDIGKNIVALMLKNHGYRVVDLGKDCPTEVIIAAIEREKPALVGLSALMTTTMVKMPEIIDRARHEGITTQFMVGGAVLTSEYAKSIGAYYAQDALAAVRLAQKLITKEKNAQ